MQPNIQTRICILNLIVFLTSFAVEFYGINMHKKNQFKYRWVFWIREKITIFYITFCVRELHEKEEALPVKNLHDNFYKWMSLYRKLILIKTNLEFNII